jgi:prophage maintenance system killer protein
MSHPYSDGNKRTAFLVAAIFLELNGYDTMRAVADKRMTEIQLASWIRGGLTAL